MPIQWELVLRSDPREVNDNIRRNWLSNRQAKLEIPVESLFTVMNFYVFNYQRYWRDKMYVENNHKIIFFRKGRRKEGRKEDIGEWL